MNEKGIDLDSALDELAKYNDEVLSKFQAQRHMLPSWGPDMDRVVSEYVEGLAYWIRGHDCWSFESRRYFGTKGPDIKEHRLVTLLPRVTQPGVTPMMAPSIVQRSPSIP
jgi:Delta6-protoilludene synthase